MSDDQPSLQKSRLNEPSIHVRTPSSDEDEKFYNAPSSSGPATPSSASPAITSSTHDDGSVTTTGAGGRPRPAAQPHHSAAPSIGGSSRSSTPATGSPHAGHASLQSPPPTASPHAREHIEPDPSSASSNSQASHHSQRNSKFLGSNGPSVLELKRFFGKGRTKHDQGVAPHHSHERKKGGGFSSFGLGKKNKKSTPQTSSPAVSPAITPNSTNSANGHNHAQPPQSQQPPHHHRQDQQLVQQQREQQKSSSPQQQHHHHHHHHNYFGHHHHTHDPNADLKDAIEPGYIEPRHSHPENTALGPDLVEHDPGYEADWDPFHVFGLAPNSERSPFLESGITKYGAVSKDMGSGAGGSVRMMKRPSDGKMFAVKEFRPRRHNETVQKYAKHVTSEYALGAALHHKNIIETIDLSKEGDQYFEVMEYGPHDYFELVMSATMTKQQIDSAFKQIVDGVAYSHSMGVAHRDSKLDNCVVTDDGVVKIIDFGSAVIFKYPMSNQIHLARGILGSDPYLAPEVFTRKPYQPQIADIWSCGIIYCCSYLRRFPWKIPQDEDPGFKRFSCNLENIDGKHPHQDNPRKITGPWRSSRSFPSDTREVLQRISQIDVKKRITMDELVHSYWSEHIVEISVLPTQL